jgi:lysylphosphatidylglycerol synthetase-like protein (DUF2156 family)
MIPKRSIGMTWLYLIFVVISATFGAMHRSRWESKFELSTVFGWFMAALCCGSNGSVLLLLGLENRQHRQLPVLTSLFFFSASLEYVLALVAIIGSIWTLRHDAHASNF